MALLLLTALAALPQQAVAQNRNVKSSALKRWWHDMNSRYNGYYNAKLRLLKSIETLETGSKDNYNQVLSLYPATTAPDAKSVSGPLDEAIKKCVVLLEIHRPHTKWADDAYMIIGMSEFIKKEYEKSEKTFKYVSIKYDPEKPISEMTKAEREKAKKEAKRAAKRKKLDKEKTAKEKKKDKEKAAKAKKKARKKAAKQKKKKSNSKDNRAYSKDGVVTTPKPTPAPPTPPSPTEDPEQKKKKEEDKKYFLKHKPVKQQAILWMAKSLVEQGDYQTAESWLTRLEGVPNLFKKVEAEINIVRAHSFITQKEYALAIEPLEKGIKLTKNKAKKTRYYYVLGQLYAKQNEAQKAAFAFRKAYKMKASFEMDFNARLNASLNEADGNAPKALSAIKRMLAESKNEEYFDQLYFAMAKIDMSTGAKDEGIAHYKKSIAVNKGNQVQKTESYYALAEIYREDNDFVNAVKYYDSTLIALDKKDERHPIVQTYVDNLRGIATALETIQLQDSLLRISAMTEEEQKELAKKIKKENLKAAIANSNKGAAVANAPTAGVNVAANVLAQSQFPIFEEKSKVKGQRDFQRKWNNRPLADNWRRANTGTINTDGGNDAVASNGTEIEGIIITQKEVETLLKGVPRTAEEVKAANGKIADAYFSLGKLYREKLSDNRRAKAALLELQRRYPDDKNAEQTLFFLYLICLEDRDNACMEQYKQIILGRFPEGNIAKSLRDPNFAMGEKAKEQQLESYYKDVYTDVMDTKAYDIAFEKISKVDNLFGKDNALKAKFALLEAFCIGALQGKTPYIAALKGVKVGFPNTDEAKRATDLLKFLDEDDATSTPTPDKGATASTSTFSFNPTQEHYVFVWIKEDASKIEAVKKSISDYNQKYHALKNLKLAGIMLSSDAPSVTVRRFDNAQKSVDYLKEVVMSPEFIPAGLKVSVMVVSQDNYRVLLQKRELQAYEDFFKETYK